MTRDLHARRESRRRHGERGETLIEFAFASVIFFTMIFGAVEFGLAVWDHNLVSDLAQEGARFAAVRGASGTAACTGPVFAPPCKASTSDVGTYVQSRAIGLTVTTTAPLGAPSTRTSGSVVEVHVKHTLAVGGGLLPAWNFDVESTAQMIVAR